VTHPQHDWPVSAMLTSLVSSQADAVSMRQRVRYVSGGSPTSFLNRSANGDRDMPISAASEAIVQLRSSDSCMRSSAALIRRSRRAAGQAASPAGRPSIQARSACTKMMSVRRETIVPVPGRAARVSSERNCRVRFSQTCDRP